MDQTWRERGHTEYAFRAVSSSDGGQSRPGEKGGGTECVNTRCRWLASRGGWPTARWIPEFLACAMCALLSFARFQCPPMEFPWLFFSRRSSSIGALLSARFGSRPPAHASAARARGGGPGPAVTARERDGWLPLRRTPGSPTRPGRDALPGKSVRAHGIDDAFEWPLAPRTDARGRSRSPLMEHCSPRISLQNFFFTQWTFTFHSSDATLLIYSLVAENLVV